MLRKDFVRPTLIEERHMKKTLIQHHNKVRGARIAIDCVPPPIYTHLTVKRKKLQLEKERIWRIEDENRRLLCRLAEITNRTRTAGKSPLSNANRVRSNAKLPRASTAVVVKSSKDAGSSPKTAGKDASEDVWRMQMSRRMRPHSVAVVQLSEPQADHCHSKIVCGCKSRQLMPLNDMTDLLCGIQSVHITAKLNSDGNLNLHDK